MMNGFPKFPQVAFATLALQLLAAQAWGHTPVPWQRVDALPGVRIAVEPGSGGSDHPEHVRLRVGAQEHVFRVETLPAGTTLYHWGDLEVLRAWDSAGGVGAAALHERLQAGDALGGISASLHPWDSVTDGRAQLEVTLPDRVRLLVVADAPMDPGEDPLTEAMGHRAPGSPLAWAELLHTAGLSGVYVGSVPAHSDAPGFRWVVFNDAAALRQVRVASADSLLLRLRAGGWRQAQSTAQPVPLLQFLAVARLQEHGLSDAMVRAALPADLAWFNRVLDAPSVPSAAQRTALWAAVPDTPEAWGAGGFTKQRALCCLSQGAAMMDAASSPLCQAFLSRMCVEEDLLD